MSALLNPISEFNAIANYRAMSKVQFSTEQIAKITDVSLRQLQWWDENGIICPARTGTSGGRRSYSARNAIAVMLLSEMRQKGFSLQRIRPTIKALTQFVSGDLAELMAGRENLYLVIDDRGRKFHFTKLTDGALRYVIDSPRPTVVIPIHPMVTTMLNRRTNAEAL